MVLGCFLMTHWAIVTLAQLFRRIDHLLTCLCTVLQLFHNALLIAHPIYRTIRWERSPCFLQFIRERLASLVVVTLENSALIFSLKDLHYNLCNGIEYKNFTRFHSDLVKQKSLGSLLVKFENFQLIKAKI